MDDDLLDKIRKFESGGQNVPNYRYDPTHTAQGFYQITDTNWKNFAPQVGISLEKFPSAMAAPEDLQRVVASHMLDQPNGIRNWTDYNPKLKAALGGQMADEQPDYASMSDDQIRELVRKDKELSKRIIQPTQTTTSDKKVEPAKTPSAKTPPKVEAPFKSGVQKFGEEGGVTVPGMWPGLQQMARGVSGILGELGLTKGGEPDWRTNVSDIIRGSATEAAPLAIPAAIGSLPEGGAWPIAKSLIGGGIGESAGQLTSQDPKTRRVAGDILGLAGSVYGPRVSMPSGRVAPAIVRQVGRMLPIPGSKMAGDFFADMMLGEKASPPRTTSTSEPKGTVKDPEIARQDKLAKEAMDRQDRLAKEERTRQEARAKEERDRAERQAKEARDRAEKAASQRQEKGPIITPVPDPQSTTGAQSVNVSVPPNVRVQNPPNLGTIPQHPTGMPQPPPQPTPPGSLGTVGPLAQQPPRPQGPIIQGTGMPQGSVQSPPPNPKLDLGTVGTLGQTRPVPPVNMPPRVPITGEIVPRTEAVARGIADAAFAKRIPPPRTSNKAVLKGFSKKLGLDTDITGEESKAAREIYDNRIRAQRPTAEVPGK